jgi:hypothetical protein
MQSLEALAFDPFNLTTDWGLVSAYRQGMWPVFAPPRATARPSSDPKGTEVKGKRVVVVTGTAPSGGTTSPSALPAAPGTASAGTPTTSSMLITPPKTLLTAPSQTVLLTCRYPLRTPTRPTWP